MSDAGTSYEVVCPHCKKQFQAEVLGGPDDQHRGFKCPHCRLFIPYGRTHEQPPEQNLANPPETL